MSNSKRSSYFYSPLKVECDQKDIIINHLKDQIYLLRRNQQELNKLEDQYRSLEHCFRGLSDQKALTDAEFKERHDHALRTIGQLKNQIDALRNDLRTKNLEINDLESDENTLIGQLDERTIELQKLKNQLKSILADNEQFLNERLRLEQTILGVKKDNGILGANAKDLQLNNNNICKKNQELEKYSSELKSEQTILKQKIMAFESQNNGLDSDINATLEDIADLESQTSNAQNDFSNLQADIAEVAALADKYKSEALHYQKATQAQTSRNNDLTKVLNQAENTHRLRVNQVDEGKREVAGLVAQNDKIVSLNGNVKDDIEFCRKHLQNLSLLNSQLVINLERYSQEDDTVINLIDRKDRVIRARVRIQQPGVLKTRNANFLEISTRKSKIKY